MGAYLFVKQSVAPIKILCAAFWTIVSTIGWILKHTTAPLKSFSEDRMGAVRAELHHFYKGRVCIYGRGEFVAVDTLSR